MDQHPLALAPGRPIRLTALPLRRLLFGLVVIVFGLATVPASSRADTTSGSTTHEITVLPCTITAAGVYYLSNNLPVSLASGNAITVSVDGVTIDFNGHTIFNTVTGTTTTAAGVGCDGYSRLTLRNGVIRSFAYGVCISSPDSDNPSYANLVENMRVLNCTFVGICVEATGSIVRGCQIYKTGGTTSPSFSGGCGVLLAFANNSVQDCDVSEVSAANNATTCAIKASGNDCLVVNNRVGGARYGVFFASGTPGKYRDNLCAASVTTPYTGGTSAGNN